MPTLKNHGENSLLPKEIQCREMPRPREPQELLLLISRKCGHEGLGARDGVMWGIYGSDAQLSSDNLV